MSIGILGKCGCCGIGEKSVAALLNYDFFPPFDFISYGAYYGAATAYSRSHFPKVVYRKLSVRCSGGIADAYGFTKSVDYEIDLSTRICTRTDNLTSTTTTFFFNPRSFWNYYLLNLSKDLAAFLGVSCRYNVSGELAESYFTVTNQWAPWLTDSSETLTLSLPITWEDAAAELASRISGCSLTTDDNYTLSGGEVVTFARAGTPPLPGATRTVSGLLIQTDGTLLATTDSYFSTYGNPDYGAGLVCANAIPMRLGDIMAGGATFHGQIGYPPVGIQNPRSFVSNRGNGAGGNQNATGHVKELFSLATSMRGTYGFQTRAYLDSPTFSVPPSFSSDPAVAPPPVSPENVNLVSQPEDVLAPPASGETIFWPTDIGIGSILGIASLPTSSAPNTSSTEL